MALLPSDNVTTYGDIAAMAGHPYAARQVGEIAHGGPSNLPWHRLVNSRGGLAVGFWRAKCIQRLMLEQDGILCDDRYRVVNLRSKMASEFIGSRSKLPLIVIIGPTASGKTSH
ncbi:MGMT family protein [Candidatus Minimicrobia naudis]|uniref:MGMT family protein n=1 Tax=Candidatus Minimicrobia naudis TaxID=2841263 RepID=A0A8F1MC84_9BACT|nr:MGMT family protein [Candidatus Minimicrobia naudis]